MTLAVASTPRDFSAEQIDLIKQTVAAGTSDLELALFLEVAKSSGLNPFQRQIYAVMRNSRVQVNGRWEQQQKMVIQTGIDGYRLIASRSGTHLGTTDPEFGPTKDGYPEWARVVVRRLVHGHVAEFPATARWSEYVQEKDEYANGTKTGRKTPTEMWARMPHTMLGKCAESLALRKAFPAELSGVYTDTEMEQADSAAPAPAQEAREAPAQVQQEAKAAPNPAEAHLKTWGPKLAGLREGLKRLGVKGEQVSEVLAEHDWRGSEAEAQKAYDRLTEWGMKLKAEQAAKLSQSDTDVVDAELKEAPAGLSEGQRKALCAHANRAGARTSEDRAALWGYCLSAAPLGTRTLTDEQARHILSMCSEWNDDEAKQALVEARTEAKGKLLDAPPAPFHPNGRGR